MVGILDHVSSKLSRSATASCVFDEFGKCSTNREFGILCRNHADQILGISFVEDIISTGSNEHRLHKICATENREVFLPFPFKFEPAGNSINKNVPPCLNKDMLHVKTAEFVSQINLPSVDSQQRVVSALISIFSSGSIFVSTMPRASLNFQMFCTPNIKSYLEKRWENSSIYVKRTNNNGQTVIEDYPMHKMPIFYQIILSSIVLSQNQLENPGNGQNQHKILQPRIILNADTFQFEYINTKEPRPLCLCRNNATFSSPLVLAGQQLHKHKIELFKQNVLYFNYTLDNIPGFCLGNAEQ